jgi:AraC-like DNA-binding protein
MVTLDQAGWNRSAVIIVPAPPAIRHLVEFLWIDERPRRSPRAHQWRIVADDAPHLIYGRFSDRLRRTDLHRLHVVGARQWYTDVDCSQRIVTVGARMRPGAIPALFRMSAAEVTDNSVAIDGIVRQSTRAILPRFDDVAATDAPALLAELVSELAARGRPIDARICQLTDVVTNRGSIHDAARHLGVTDRALRAWSAMHLGIGLRRFMSIRRLHAALETRIRHSSETWSRIAAATGYADQSHLVRDCHALLGESPGEYLARAD